MGNRGYDLGLHTDLHPAVDQGDAEHKAEHKSALKQQRLAARLQQDLNEYAKDLGAHVLVTRKTGGFLLSVTWRGPAGPNAQGVGQAIELHCEEHDRFHDLIKRARGLLNEHTAIAHGKWVP
jgi:hypothetical protein